MFKWPEPPEGQLYYKQPLIIYFSVSVLLTALVGLSMLYYSDEGVARAWQVVRGLFTGRNPTHWPTTAVTRTASTTTGARTASSSNAGGLQSREMSVEGQMSSSQTQLDDGLGRSTAADKRTSSHTSLAGRHLSRNIWNRAQQPPSPHLEV